MRHLDAIARLHMNAGMESETNHPSPLDLDPQAMLGLQLQPVVPDGGRGARNAGFSPLMVFGEDYLNSIYQLNDD